MKDEEGKDGGKKDRKEERSIEEGRRRRKERRWRIKVGERREHEGRRMEEGEVNGGRKKEGWQGGRKDGGRPVQYVLCAALCAVHAVSCAAA